MNCSNCGNFNNPGSKFCIKCGQSLSNESSFNEQISSSRMENQEGIVQSESIQNSVYASPAKEGLVDNKMKSIATSRISFMGYFFIMIAVILKPFTAFKEELNKFSHFKNSFILSLIVSLGATVINLLTTMWKVVRVKTFSWTTGEYTTSWVWDNLKELKYVEIIAKNFLIYLGAIFAIAVVYYVVSLIFKKQSNFPKLLGVSTLAIIPLLICFLILSPLLSLIWAELAMPVILIGAVYTIVIIYEGINSEILLEGNAKYYFNLICLSILGIAAYYLCMKLFLTSITSGLNGLDDFMNLFG